MTHARFFSLLIAISACLASAGQEESLNYKIYWKCGLIDKEAASATIQVDYDAYYATLEGRSIDVFGTVYCINDTIRSTFSAPSTAVPGGEENVEYISGYYRKPKHNQPYDWNSPWGYRTIAGEGYLSADAATVECVTLTANLLCMFHYARQIDFAGLPIEQPVNIPIHMPDGTSRTLQLVNNGYTDYSGRPAYNVTVNFTYGDGFSQYPITVIIDNYLRVPLEFSASIAIGAVKMVYCL